MGNGNPDNNLESRCILDNEISKVELEYYL
jgi:hypothetical protein